ncbi:hypothetical protein V8C44DRAFT_324326 [Trichoderma aethiopicum]
MIPRWPCCSPYLGQPNNRNSILWPGSRCCQPGQASTTTSSIQVRLYTHTVMAPCGERSVLASHLRSFLVQFWAPVAAQVPTSQPGVLPIAKDGMFCELPRYKSWSRVESYCYSGVAFASKVWASPFILGLTLGLQVGLCVLIQLFHGRWNKNRWHCVSSCCLVWGLSKTTFFPRSRGQGNACPPLSDWDTIISYEVEHPGCGKALSRPFAPSITWTAIGQRRSFSHVAVGYPGGGRERERRNCKKRQSNRRVDGIYATILLANNGDLKTGSC